MPLSVWRGTSGSCIPWVLSGFAAMSCNVPSAGKPLLGRLISLALFSMVWARHPLLMAVKLAVPALCILQRLALWSTRPLRTGWRRANGEGEAFGCFLCWTSCHDEGSATFPGCSQVKGNIDRWIQTDLLVFTSPLLVSRSHRTVTGCRSENVLAPFRTYFSSNDSLQSWDICSFS